MAGPECDNDMNPIMPTSRADGGAMIILRVEPSLFSALRTGFQAAVCNVLTFNEGGLIETVRLYHRPYHQVIEFADELASSKRLELPPWKTIFIT